jgi:hypothetical protein
VRHYLIGLDSAERDISERLPGIIENYDRKIRRLKTLEEALFFGLEYRNKVGYIEHLMTIHPENPAKILERAMADAKIEEDWKYLALRYGRNSKYFQLAFYNLR